MTTTTTNDNKPPGAVLLLFNPQPLADVGKYAKAMPKHAVIDPRLAQIAGAVVAMGTPENCAHVSELLAPAALERTRKQHPGIAPRWVKWLAIGERGTSSEVLFQHLSGIKVTNRNSTPRDTDDFRRCQKMLQQTGLCAKLHRAASISPEWFRLMDRWNEINFLIQDQKIRQANDVIDACNKVSSTTESNP